MTYQPRVLEAKLKEYLNFFSVVAVTGPRQSGKSTLIQKLLKDYTYVTFDDYRILAMFEADPEKFMRIYNDKVVFDEVQKAPTLFNYIKIAVDQNRKKTGKFVLTGSSQFSFIHKISESLAGRMGLLELLPYQYTEIHKNLRDESVFRGGYPELVGKHYRLFEDWFASYLETYLNKDVSILAHIGDMRDFRRLIALLAANTGQILNMSRFASDLGVDVKTIKRWISILEASYIIFLLPPYYNNFGKRIVRSPKLYFYDTGLVSFLVGINSKDGFEKGPMLGSLFENYLVAEIKKKETHQKTHANLYYYRTSHGVEVDLIIDRKNTKDFIEVKHSETFKPKMLEAIEALLGKQNRGYLLYSGKTMPYETIRILNYKEYLADF